MNTNVLYGRALHEISTLGRVSDETAQLIAQHVTSDDYQRDVLQEELDRATAEDADPADADPARIRNLRRQLRQHQADTAPPASPEPAAAGDPAGDGDDPGTKVPGGTVNDVLDWVDDDPDRARLALDAEQDRPSPRSTLVDQLEDIIDDEER